MSEIEDEIANIIKVIGASAYLRAINSSPHDESGLNHIMSCMDKLIPKDHDIVHVTDDGVMQLLKPMIVFLQTISASKTPDLATAILNKGVKEGKLNKDNLVTLSSLLSH